MPLHSEAYEVVAGRNDAHYVAVVTWFAMLACACCHSPLKMRQRGQAIAG